MNCTNLHWTFVYLF